MRVFALAAFLVSAACSGSEAPSSPDVGAADAPALAGDPLLRSARQTLQDGAVDPELATQLRASEDPAHARARRILEVIDLQDPPGEGAGAGDEVVVAEKSAPGLVAPAGLPSRPKVLGREPSRTSGAEGSAPPAPLASPPASATETGGRAPRAVVTGLRLQETRRGDVTFTIKANRGLVVGIANQRESGFVRLVLDSAQAPPKVLSSRPSAAGVSVHSVSRGTESVFVTLRLAPGWRLGRTKRMPGGAQVTLAAP